MQRLPLIMTTTTTGKDDPAEAPVVTYQAGQRYDVGPDLYDVFVNQMQVASAAPAEPEQPPAGEPPVPGEVQRAPAARETKPARAAASRATKPKPAPKKRS